MSLNAVYMIRDVITGAFTHKVGKWQGIFGTGSDMTTDKKALLVLFKIKNKHVQMLIHAPANYVGVYIRKGKGKWNCICYHDSCWRDEIDRFLFEHRENMHFAFSTFFGGEKIGTTVEHITDAVLVVKLSEEQIKEFNQIREKKYN